MEKMVQMMWWWETVKGALKDEKGQGMVEYGLILALIAVVVIGVMTSMGGNLNTMLGNVSNNIK